METGRSGGSPSSIVLIDDDADLVGHTAMALRRRGFDVATSGADADAFRRACELQPKTIVVALHASTGGALPLLRQLATDARTRTIPIVVTRCAEESLRLRAQRLGTVASLLGDCTADTLASELDRVIQEAGAPPRSAARTSFPIPCPRCRSLTGVPRSVTTAANGGTYVTLQCESCSEEWRVLRPSVSLGVRDA
jgi:ActR/RegA family two-component response regulator